MNTYLKMPNLIYNEINTNKIQTADIVVGLPSYEEESNIAETVQRVAKGLNHYYPNLSSVIINCDNYSSDNTKNIFLNTEVPVNKIYLSTAPSVLGKGANFKNLVQKAAQLNAKAILTFDSNLKSIKKSWIKYMVDPILSGKTDLVTPIFLRHKFDGPITNSFVYPFLRSMFGRRIKQAVSVDYAFSQKLNQVLLNNSNWPNNNTGYIVDIIIVLTAICHNLPICQSLIPYPRLSESKEINHSFADLFKNILKNFFDCSLKTEDFWLNIKRSKPTQITGTNLKIKELPPQSTFEKEALYNQFQNNLEKEQNIWAEIFSQNIKNKLQYTITQPLENFNFEPNTWAECVFQALLNYKKASEDEKDKIISSIIPLFFAKLLDFNKKADAFVNKQQLEALLEQEALIFEDLKKDFCLKWLNK